MLFLTAVAILLLGSTFTIVAWSFLYFAKYQKANQSANMEGKPCSFVQFSSEEEHGDVHVATKSSVKTLWDNLFFSAN